LREAPDQLSRSLLSEALRLSARFRCGHILRTFLFGHVRQRDAAASRWLDSLAAATPIVAGIDDLVRVDIDDTVKEVHGHQKQGAGFGYSGVR